MNRKKLRSILARHAKWLAWEKGGKCADLEGAYLVGADLRGANFTCAHLDAANLYRADLRGAELFCAHLRHANLIGANLRGAYLGGAELRNAHLYGANLQGADLSGADLRSADLRDADLRHADLRRAYLGGAILEGANLEGASLYGARLEGAILEGIKGFSALMHIASTPLSLLRSQPGKIRAYKLVNENFEGPVCEGIRYEVGETYTVEADDDETEPYSYGINLTDLGWCLEHWRPGCHVLVVEFTAKDIAAIPVGSREFRVRRCRVIGELDLSDYGL